MNEDRGAALRLLYQLKLALDKHFTTDNKGVTNLKKSFIDKKYQKSQEFMHTLKKQPMQTLKAQQFTVHLISLEQTWYHCQIKKETFSEINLRTLNFVLLMSSL